MPHRRRLAHLPTFGLAQTLAPRFPGRSPRVAGVALSGGNLVFRADGGVPPGIYVQEVEGSAPPRLLLPDPPGFFLGHPTPAGELLALSQGVPGRVPARVEELVFVNAGAEVLRVPGQTLGVSGDGTVALVVDVLHKVLRRVDLRAGTVRELASFSAGMDVQVSPVPVLDAAGTTALFMDARQERGDASLEQVSLADGTRKTVVAPLPPPARLAGAPIPGTDAAVVLEQRLGDTPHFRLLRVAVDRTVQVVLSLPVSQPLVAPAFVNHGTMVLPLSLQPHPGATYGPVDLVAVNLDGGTPVPLTRSGDVTGRCRLAGADVVVEGGAALLKVPLLAG